jgi:heme A synthase
MGVQITHILATLISGKKSIIAKEVNMNTSLIWVAISIVVLAVIALFVFFVRRDRKENRLTPLAGLAFGFVLAGILFGDDRLIGYGLMGVGVILAVIDMFKRSRSK